VHEVAAGQVNEEKPPVNVGNASMVDEVKSGAATFLKQYWFIITAIVVLAGDFSVGQYRLQQNHDRIVAIEKRLDPKAFQEYGELKQTVRSLERRVQQLENKLWGGR